MKKRFDLRLWTGIGALALVVGGLAAPQAQAETLAWWRMDGTAGTTVTASQNGTAYAVAVPDTSASGNALAAMNTTGSAVVYSSELPPNVTGPNGTSIMRPASANSASLFTWSSQSNPSGTDLETVKLSQFTVEAFAKPTATDITPWHNVVTRDGGDIHRVFKLASATPAYKFYRITITECVGGTNQLPNLANVKLMDASGNDIATTATGTVTASSETGDPWYELATNAFDDKLNTFWTAGQNIDASGGSVWIQIELNTAASISSYGLLQRGAIWANGNRAPKAFVLAGSNDGTNWTDIDSETNVSIPTPDASPFELQINDQGKYHVTYVDAMGITHDAASTDNIVADHWYYFAATMDGSALNIYMTDLTANPNQPAQLVGTADVTNSPDPSLIAQPDTQVTGVLAPRKAWAIMRGYYASGNGNWWNGQIDEVRISDTALDIPTKGLRALGVPVTISQFSAE